MLLREKAKLFSCDDENCSKSFAHFSLLETHKKSHKGDKPHKCNQCSKSYKHLYSLNEHKILHTGEKLHKCEECSKSFWYLSGLINHKKVHTSDKKYQARENSQGICNKTEPNPNFISDFGELSFIKKENEELEQKSEICDKKQNDYYNDEKFLDHDGPNKFYGHLPLVETHKISHKSEKPHKCDYCSKTYKNLNSLDKHKLLHKGESSHKMEEEIFLGCSSTIQQNSRENGLNINEIFENFSYIKQEKEDPEEKYKNESFENNSDFPNEKRIFQCDECNKSYAHLSLLETHKKSHTKEKPHKCDQCSKSYKHLYSLKEHKLLHTDSKPHKCKECGNSFKYLSGLVNHKKVHLEEKIFYCPKCGEGFSKIFQLNKHSRRNCMKLDVKNEKVCFNDKVESSKSVPLELTIKTEPEDFEIDEYC